MQGQEPIRIAVVHDWLVSIAGGERVLKEILTCFPEADLFAVVDFLDDGQRAQVVGKVARTTFVQRLPRARTKYRSYLPLMPLVIEQLDVSGFDLVISSSHAVAKGVITGPDQVRVSYVHSPIRYAWICSTATFARRTDEGAKGSSPGQSSGSTQLTASTSARAATL